MATLSECRYRWLRVLATTFVITHSPSRFNRRDGLSFSGNSGGGRWIRSGKVQRYQVHLEWRRATGDDEHYVCAIPGGRILQTQMTVWPSVNQGFWEGGGAV
jgi:hypothetical protein